jgi:glucose dehydrogenase
MFGFSRFGFSASLAAFLLIWTLVARAGTVDDARLRAAVWDPSNWVTFGHDYTNQRFSGLGRINRANVARLAPAWVHQTGIVGTFQTHPLVVDGMMVITTPHNHVTTLDAATGAVLWRYRHTKRTEKTRGGPADRGAAVGYGKVYQATGDGRLIALDRDTGALVWDRLIATPAPGEVEALAGIGAEARQAFIDNVGAFPAKMPPLVAAGKVIVGVTSAEFGLFDQIGESNGSGGLPGPETQIGRRGYLVALDAETGAEVWRWHTVKADGWEGEFRATTADGVALPRDIAAERAAADRYPNAWRRGGGATWSTPAYDPELGLIYLGTGNPSPTDAGSLRPGDNLHTSSLVALEIDTGALRWHYQTVPHDIWGYDVASPPVLFEVPSGAGPVEVVAAAGKNGWFYVLDRTAGTLLFKSEPLVPQRNQFTRPTPDGVVIAPGGFGGASWSPGSYDPRTGYMYIPAIHKPTELIERTIREVETGATVTFTSTELTDEPDWGTLSAVDTRAGGRIVWQARTDRPLVGGVLATAGGLVFAGEGNGDFTAFDSATGARLWRFHCGAGVNAPPMAYEIDGVQYVAVAAGGSRLFGFPAGDAVFAFGLAGG